MNKQKLELTWIGKDKKANLEPRILVHESTKSFNFHKSEDDQYDNKLIFGDNLLALKSLESEFRGKVKCIYIDPPYNTGNAFEHYDDGIENSIWLSLIRQRLELLWILLKEDGYLAVQIDDNQFARLYILMSELFGEKNLKTICVKMSESTGVKMSSVKSGGIAKLKEYIILAGKSGIKGLKLEKIRKEEWDPEYKLFANGVSKDELEFIKVKMNDKDRSDADIKKIDSILSKINFDSNIDNIIEKELGINPKLITSLKKITDWKFNNAWRIFRSVAVPASTKEIAVSKKLSFQNQISSFSIITPTKELYIIKGDFNIETPQPRCKLLFADQYLEIHPGDFWSDIKTTGLNNEGGVKFTNGKKPEKLIERIIKMCSKPGDLVLDSFAGSGTTGAVAHKLKRKWILVELGEHCHTHIIPRLKRVIKGEDPGGITQLSNWTGGGGFKYYSLAPSLLEKDKWGNLIINKKYNSQMLTKAMCKHMGFYYSPNNNYYWMHGKSSESDYIYVTTNSISYEQLKSLSQEVTLKRTLLVCCKAYNCDENAFDNLSIIKIPQALLNKCEWEKNDYSLNIQEQ